jgi:hypothetical protein
MYEPQVIDLRTVDIRTSYQNHSSKTSDCTGFCFRCTNEMICERSILKNMRVIPYHPHARLYNERKIPYDRNNPFDDYNDDKKGYHKTGTRGPYKGLDTFATGDYSAKPEDYMKANPKGIKRDYKVGK